MSHRAAGQRLPPPKAANPQLGCLTCCLQLAADLRVGGAAKDDLAVRVSELRRGFALQCLASQPDEGAVELVALPGMRILASRPLSKLPCILHVKTSFFIFHGAGEL